MKAPEVDSMPSDQRWVQVTDIDEHDVWGFSSEDLLVKDILNVSG